MIICVRLLVILENIHLDQHKKCIELNNLFTFRIVQQLGAEIMFICCNNLKRVFTGVTKDFSENLFSYCQFYLQFE